MTVNQIEKKAQRQMMKFEVAKQVRAILDAARKTYGTEDWDNEDMESEIIELVTEEA